MEYPTPVIYVAGPMTGLPQFNAPAFFDAADQLIGFGYDVRNPAQHDIDMGFNPYKWSGTESLEETGFDLEAAMKWDLEQVRNADAIVVLPGANKSKGTNLEIAEANKFGTPVIYWDNIAKIKGRYNDALGLFKLACKNIAVPCRLHENVTDKPFGRQKFQNWALLTAKECELVRRGESLLNSTNINLSLDQINKFASGGYIDQSGLFAPGGVMNVTDEVRSVSATGGEKGTKLARFDLLPTAALKQVAEHYGRGADKYDDNQWRLGYEWSKSFAALERHANAFWGGEDMDPETGSNHMAAVAWHALALLTFFTEYPEYDDRYKA